MQRFSSCILYIITAFFICTHVYAQPVCEQQVYLEKMPEASTQMRKNKIKPLCFHGFTIGYAYVLKTPLWAAEYLTRERLELADTLERTDHFHAEKKIPPRNRIELKEMRARGHDRGHLAPHRDMSTHNAQYDSFSFANIALQNSKHNRHHWSKIERYTRGLAYKYGQAYVVTGVVVPRTKSSRKTNKHGVIIPSHFYKAVYIPRLKKAGVYWSENNLKKNTQIISIQSLYQKTGIDVMPRLEDNIKKNVYQLPLSSKELDYKHTPKDSNGKPHQSTKNDKLEEDTKNFIVALIVLFVKELIILIKNLL